MQTLTFFFVLFPRALLLKSSVTFWELWDFQTHDERDHAIYTPDAQQFKADVRQHVNVLVHMYETYCRNPLIQA